MANETMRASVFNIQKYSVHDGPGIRTIVFLQGCPLHCPWCANPEGKAFSRVLSHNRNLCKACGRCTAVCPQKALSIEDGVLKLDRGLCDLCGKCINTCRMDCYKIFGEEKTVEEILKEVMKDENFYSRSGGGLTVSGGEPLAHPAFLKELLRTAKEKYSLSTAIETTSFADEDVFRSVIPYVDHYLCDIKLTDSARSREVLGVPSEPILRNIRILADEFPDKDLLLRMPVIPTYNDDGENIEAIAEFINSLGRKVSLELLPYHEFGKGKYDNLGSIYEPALRGVSAPSKERMQEISSRFESLGVSVICT